MFACVIERQKTLVWGEDVIVGVCDCVRWVRHIKVKRSRCGWLDFRGMVTASPVSYVVMHTECVWYEILNNTDMSQSVFACLHFSMRYVYVCLCVRAFQLKVQ